MMRYQFETIHPFLNGNGRIGRLLINLLLKSRGRLDMPLPYLSSFLDSHRSEYYATLQGVRESGDLEPWLSFFFGAVESQATDASRRAQHLIAVREEFLQAAFTTRSRLPLLVEQIMKNPLVTARSVERGPGITNQGARDLIRNALRMRWLTHRGTGRNGAEHWVAHRVLDILETPMGRHR